MNRLRHLVRGVIAALSCWRRSDESAPSAASFARALAGAACAVGLVGSTRTALAGTLGIPSIIKLTSPHPTLNGGFGHSFAAPPGEFAVGAPGDLPPDAIAPGAVYLYRTQGLEYLGVLLQPDPVGNETARFGWSLAAAKVGDAFDDLWLAVGAPERNSSQGAVYMYQSGENGLFEHRQTLEPPGGLFQPLFGTSIAIRDDRMVIGSPGYDFGLYRYVYNESTDRWESTGDPLLPLPDEFKPGSNSFGLDVAIDVDRVAVPSPASENGPDNPSGAVYVYDFDTGEMEARIVPACPGCSPGETGQVFAAVENGMLYVCGSNQRLERWEWTGTDWIFADFFDLSGGWGFDVVLHDGRIAVGGTETTHVFDVGGEEPVESAHFVFPEIDSPSPGESDAFGYAVMLGPSTFSLIGDLRRDVMLVGAPRDHELGFVSGAVYLVFEDTDTDFDSLLDGWEAFGVPYLIGRLSAKYPLTGADPERRDIFVEVDYFDVEEFAPADGAFSPVVAAFAARNITLHVERGDGIPYPPPVDWTLDDTDGDGVVDWCLEFDELKLTAVTGAPLPGYFGTLEDRESPVGAERREARSKAYRYCIFADTLDPQRTNSGLGELHGNDFIVSLGAFDTGRPDWSKIQAGTFMHELGHTLGLRHGGGDNTPNKPVYYSVMNYVWQMPAPWVHETAWPLASGRPGYSPVDLGVIDEEQVDECFSLLPPNHALARIAVPHNTRLTPPGGPPILRNTRLGDVPDWDGLLPRACPPDGQPTPVDLNWLALPGLGDKESPGETLHGHDDWSVIDLDFRDDPNFAPGYHYTGLGIEFEELTLEAFEAIETMLPPFCQADLDANRTVGFADLLIVLGGWGPCDQDCTADIEPVDFADGNVNFSDLLAILAGWGPCP